MLAVSTPLRSNKDDSCREIMGEMAETRSTNTATAGFSSIGSSSMDDSFPTAADDDFSAGNLLDSIDFDDLFVGIHDVDVLPDLEMDPELLAEFSLSLSPDPAGGEYSVDAQFVNSPPSNTIFSGDAADFEDNSYSKCNSTNKDDDDDDKSAVRQVVGRVGGGGSPFEEEKKEQGKDEATTLEIAHKSKKQGSYESQEEEEEETEAAVVVMSPNSNNNSSSSPKDGDPDCCKRKKWSSKSSRNNDAGYSSSSTTTTTTGHNNQSKRKAKVDWTPELHRRFVQAVEQLGVDKAVPSRILELMGIDCLTRHNIASHLQKYRSHRKHLLAREADAASWSQKRQMYGAAAMGAGGKGAIVNPWHATTIGFPPAMAPPPPVPPPASTIHPHHFRPLHVWGHPTHNQSMMPPPPMWPPPPLTADPAAYWHPPHHHVPNGVAPARPCFPIPPPLPTTRFSASPVPGLPPHAMYRPDLGIPGAGQPSQTAPLDFHPTKESIDAAIGDVLAKPYLPLPIGLKPPAVDSVLVELQRQGVPKIPPSCA